MHLTLICKHCHSDLDRSSDELASGVRCSSCNAAIAPELGRALAEDIVRLAAHMAAAREDFRFEVLLETDDLPAPHGFDAKYVLPEERVESESETT